MLKWKILMILLLNRVHLPTALSASHGRMCDLQMRVYS